MSYNNDVIMSLLRQFKHLHDTNQFVTCRGMKTVEILNATMVFSAAEDGIITIPNFSTSEEYVMAELAWYESCDNKASFIAEFAKLWDDIANKRGFVNSNYGHLVFSPQNCMQFDNAIAQLKEDPQSRRAVMVYCPNHIHYTGGNDYVCTMYTSHTIRDGKLHTFVNMRSSDLRFGVVGADLAWHCFVNKKMCEELGVEPGNIYWHADSLHMYERHFKIFGEL